MLRNADLQCGTGDELQFQLRELSSFDQESKQNNNLAHSSRTSNENRISFLPPINHRESVAKTALAFGDIDIGEVKHIYDFRRKRNKENSSSLSSNLSSTDRGTVSDNDNLTA